MNLKNIFSFRDMQDEAKPFLDHIEDLRWMLIKTISVLVLSMIVAFSFQRTIFWIVERPMLSIDPDFTTLTNFGVADPLTIAIQLSFYTGLIIAFPFIVFFLAEFIMPALTAQEKRMLIPVSVFAFGLFMGGVAFAYFFVLPSALDYFNSYAKYLNFKPQWSVREYFSFVTQFIISFGLAFELPLGVLVLVKLGLLSHETLKRTRAFAVVIILVLAAIITPTSDVFTLLLMAGPMYVLYEACILISWMMERKARKTAELGE